MLRNEHLISGFVEHNVTHSLHSPSISRTGLDPFLDRYITLRIPVAVFYPRKISMPLIELSTFAVPLV